jgi:hypothetical protein
MLTALNRDSLLSLADTPLKPLKVETTYGEVFVPRLTAKTLADFLDAMDDGTDKGTELARIIVDQYGTRLFTDADATRLACLPAGFSVAVTRAFREANGLVPKGSAATADLPTGSRSS